MPRHFKHEYDKDDLILCFERILNHTLGKIDDKGIFDSVRQYPRRKGIAGTVIEQCVLRYLPDSDQSPDLLAKGSAVVDELLSTPIL